MESENTSVTFEKFEEVYIYIYIYSCNKYCNLVGQNDATDQLRSLQVYRIWQLSKPCHLHVLLALQQDFGY